MIPHGIKHVLQTILIKIAAYAIIVFFHSPLLIGLYFVYVENAGLAFLCGLCQHYAWNYGDYYFSANETKG